MMGKMIICRNEKPATLWDIDILQEFPEETGPESVRM